MVTRKTTQGWQKYGNLNLVYWYSKWCHGSAYVINTYINWYKITDTAWDQYNIYQKANGMVY